MSSGFGEVRELRPDEHLVMMSYQRYACPVAAFRPDFFKGSFQAAESKF